MSQQINLGKITLKAGDDLSTKMYHIVKLDNNGNVVLCGAGERAIGILDGKPKLGESVAVNILGTSKVVVGGAINIGSYVVSNNNGQAIERTNESNVIGIALESSSNAGEIIEVLLMPLAL